MTKHRINTTIERHEDLDCFFVHHTIHTPAGPNTNTFYVRDDMTLDAQRPMFIDAMYEMFGDDATSSDVDAIMRDLERQRNELGLSS